MALSKSAAGASINSILVLSQNAGSGGTVYTVPDDKVFKGYIFAESSAGSSLAIYINGTNFTTALGNTTGESWASFIFPPGTILANSGTDYFMLTGELFDGS